LHVARLTSVLAAVAVAAALLQTGTSAAPGRIVAWPGSVVSYRDLTGGAGYHSAIRAAASAWNRLQLGARFVRVHGRAEVTFSARKGECLVGRAGRSSLGFQASGSSIRLASSCPSIVRKLLVAHELGRVLGLPNDDSRCSLMNSHAISDGLTYVVPAKCSRKHPPAWLKALIDPGSAALAHTIYTPPLPTGSISLSVDTQGIPSVSWSEPDDPVAVRTVLVRKAGPCPRARDVAVGSVAFVYDDAAATGAHSVTDSAFPAGETDCYRAFRLNEYGRMAPSPDAISYTLGGPIAGFTVSAPPTAGTPTTFDDVSGAPRSSIVHWHWDFGDPKGANDVVDTSDPAVGREVSHTYAKAGAYTVTLTVTDAGGRVSTMLQDVRVQGS
jgi:hypothetical protein